MVGQDAKDTAAVIRELASDDELRCCVGQQARSRAEQWPWSSSVRATVRVYESLLDYKSA
jgi:hypothetical protein